jgi:4-amino-4-deoxy-L-arabinose transferase-like glycosyltransferase
MYVHHAKNIVEGRPYTATGYLFHPSISVSPRMYPPVFPFFLAPVIRLFGMNLLAMKIEQVIFFVLVLAVVSLYWRRDLGPECTLALVAILGFSPHFWAAKDNVLSDLLFLLFFYVAVFLVQRVPRCEGDEWRCAILIGFVVYLAIGTRTVGVALIAGLLLHDLVKYRTVTRITVIALSTCASLIFLQSCFLSSGFSGYAGQAHPTVHTVAAHLFSYPRTLAGPIPEHWLASGSLPLTHHSRFWYWQSFHSSLSSASGIAADWK